ncbi:hypothetical protein, partial [Cnuella takakiae]
MEKEIKRIVEVLTGVGFPESLEWTLQVHLCFAPAKFSITHEQFRGEDHLRYQIWIVRDEETGLHAPAYYDALLVRPLDIKPLNEGVEGIFVLNQQMQLVNWAALLEKGENATVGDFADLQLIAQIVQALNALENSEEGALY